MQHFRAGFDADCGFGSDSAQMHIACQMRIATDQIRQDLVQCGNDKSRMEGANGTLLNQSRDQQNTINNCQTQALKLLTPIPIKLDHPVYVREFPSSPAQPLAAGVSRHGSAMSSSIQVYSRFFAKAHFVAKCLAQQFVGHSDRSKQGGGFSMQADSGSAYGGSNPSGAANSF